MPAAPPGPLRDARAVVFDLDGTLVDSVADITTHLNAALVDAGLAPRPRAFIQGAVGHGARQLVERVVDRPDQVDAILAEFRTRYRAAPVIETHVYPGVEDALAAIAPGRALAVLSNKPDDLTVTIVHRLLARWSFAAIAGQRAGVPMKPDPSAARRIAAELGVAPADCAFVGDSEIDVETARAAGMRSVAVAWGLRDRAVLVGSRPDHLVDTPAALAALF